MLSRVKICAFWGLLLVSQPTWARVQVKEVDFQSRGEIDKDRVVSLLGVQPGEDFSMDALDKGLKRIADTGRFQSVSSGFNRSTGKLVVQLELFDVLDQVQVQVRSNDSASDELLQTVESDIKEVIALSPGDKISLEGLPEIRERIRQRLALRGFLAAKVVLALEESENEFSRVLLADVELDAQESLDGLIFEGFSASDIRNFRKLLERVEYIRSPLLSLDVPAELLNTPEEYFLERFRRGQDANRGKAVRFDLKMPYDQISINSAMSDWGKEVRSKGFYDFTIEGGKVEEAGKSFLKLRLNRGLEYNVQFKGNVNFWERFLRSKVLDRSSRLGIPFSITDAESIVRKLYLAEGYKDVKIESISKVVEGVRRVEINIEEGTQYYLGVIRWEGVNERERRVLREIESYWRQEQSSPFHRTYFSEKALQSTLPQLLSEIQQEGYLQARFLGFSPVDSRDNISNQVDVKLPIQLGPRFTVKSVVVDGRFPLSTEEIDELRELETDEVASSVKIVEMGFALRSAVRERGYLLAEVPTTLEEIVEFSDDSDEVILNYALTLGPRVSLGQIIPEGLERVKEKVVLREFAREDLDSGSTWVPSKIERIDERLLSYGLFNNLRIQSVVGNTNVVKDTETGEEREAQERDIRIIVTERPGGAVEFGPGYRTDLGLVAFSEFNYRNLFGMNRSVVARAEVSRRLENYIFPEQRYSLSYLEPYLLGYALRARVGMTYERSSEIQFDNSNTAFQGFNKEVVTLSLTSSFELSRYLNMRWNVYTLSVPRIFDLIGEDTADGSLRYRIATLGPTLVWDRRDNIFDPTKGWMYSTGLEYAGPSIGSGDGVHFLLSQSEINHYFPMKPGLVFAASASYSYMKALGDAVTIPENRRLVLGGRTSIRSLQERQLRFDQTDVASMHSYLAKVELRQSLFADLGIAFFLDSGRVDASGFESDGWRSAGGLGARYLTAVGPLALDFAFNMNKREGEDFTRVLFSVGVF